MIRRAEGFAHFTTAADWQAKGHNYAGQAPVFSPTLGRDGRGCARMTQNISNQSLATIMPVAMSPIYSHIAFKHPILTDIYWGYANTASYYHIRVIFHNDGSISIWRDSVAGASLVNLNFATQIAISPPAIWRANTFHHVQTALKPAPAASGGFFLLKLDGVEIPSLTLNNFNTFAGGSTDVTRISRSGGGGGATQYSDEVEIDNVIVDGAIQQWTGLQGDLAVFENVSPIDGDELAWTRSSGAGTWSSHVNQNPQDADATYLRSTAPGVNNCFSNPVLSATVGRVLAVKNTICSRKEDATFGAIRPYLRDTLGVNHEGPLMASTQTYKFDEYLWEKDPKDGANWDVARVNVSQLGFTDAGDEGV